MSSSTPIFTNVTRYRWTSIDHRRISIHYIFKVKKGNIFETQCDFLLTTSKLMCLKNVGFRFSSGCGSSVWSAECSSKNFTSITALPTAIRRCSILAALGLIFVPPLPLGAHSLRSIIAFKTALHQLFSSRLIQTRFFDSSCGFCVFGRAPSYGSDYQHHIPPP